MRICKWLLLTCIISTSWVTAQVPTLDPTQTVNPATGSMGFALPLCRVHGVNGHDFPINLYYQSGIRYNQVASPVGLGFSYEPGSIVKHPVFVNDEISNGTTYAQVKTPGGHITTGIYGTWEDITRVAAMTASWIGGSAGGAFGLICTLVFLAAQGSQAILSNVVATSADYTAGGAYLPAYNFDAGHGMGYLHNGNGNDLPDIYTVSTPWVTGEIIPVNATSGDFIFRQSTGTCGTTTTNTVKVKYANGKFTITLADGMRLLFEVTKDDQFYKFVYYRRNDKTGLSYAYFTESQNLNEPEQWFLTKVFYPDYVDGDGDLNPTTSPQLDKGSWICFKYTKTMQYFKNQLPVTVQTSKYTAMELMSGEYAKGGRLCDVYLDSVITPNEYAVYNYTDGRADDLWFNASDFDWRGWGSGTAPRAYDMFYKSKGVGDTIAKPAIRKILSNIKLYSHGNNQLQITQFNTDYMLAKHSLNSMTKSSSAGYAGIAPNYEGGRLTLESIATITQDLPTVYTRFSYKSNPIACLIAPIKALDDNIYVWPEFKDCWGYYCTPKDSVSNDFNPLGNQARATSASAWSLDSIHFQTGMAIKWEYEPNRYASVNGAPITMKFGGGVRVKTMIVTDGIIGTDGSHTQAWSYFYTKQTGIFDESAGGCSGYASVEPFNYISETDYRPLDCMKGGFYTPAQVAYSKIQVVQDYAPGTANPTPKGYVESQFTSTTEYPNGGTYGQNDESWKRGLPTAVIAYNSKGALISKQSTDYEIIQNAQPIGIGAPAYMELRSYGIIRPIRARALQSGLEKVTDFSYAQNVSTDKDALIENSANIVLQFPDPLKSFIPTQTATYSIQEYTFYTNLINNQTQRDIIKVDIVAPQFVDYINVYMYIIPDIENGYHCPPSKIYNFQFAYNPLTLDSFAVVKVGNNQAEIGLKFGLGRGVFKERLFPNVTVDANGVIQTSGTPTPISYPTGGLGNSVTREAQPEYQYIESVQKVTDLDGIPNLVTTTNSDGTKVLAQNIPAYWKYPAMNTSKHMLSENYGSISYKTSVSPQNAVSSSATTWKDWGNTTWLPCSSFAWKSAMNANGLPGAAFTDFNAASKTNPNWLFKGRIDKYNASSSVTQQTQPPNTPSVTKYAKLTNLPIATITNSNDSGCAVWTCDYDDPSWTKRNATLTNVKKHFGENCVYVNGGVGAQTGLYGVTAKDYTLSAWVCPVNGGSIVLAADKYINGAGTNVGYLEKIYTSTSFNNWFYVELTIPKANLMDMNGNGTMLVITVQSKGTSAQFYLDDVRFAPSNSLINTTYYSSTFGLPILTVDQNNLPSERTTYDSFARPILSEKIDRTKSAGDASSSTALAKKQYKLAAQ